jgi:serine protease Do
MSRNRIARFAGAGALLAGALALGVRSNELIAEDARTAQAEPAVQRAIERVYPALVQIHVLEVAYTGGHERKQEAAGSGAIISPEGFVVTNHHVAGKASTIRVILSSKEELPATLVGTDALADIAIVKLDLSARAKDAAPLPVAHWGKADLLKVGDPVLAMGCPLALSHSVTKGIVANKELMMARFVRTGNFMLDGEDVGSIVKWIGHDATIQPGNSGGPLVNLDGEIVGINEIGLGTMAGAIPSEIASAVAAEIIDHGKVHRSWVGIEFQPLLKSENKPGAQGVLVSGIIPGSPAEVAGVKPGDVVTALDGTPVQVRFREELPEFNRLLLSKPAGNDVRLTFVRDGAEQTVTLKSDLRDDAEGTEAELRSWGITGRELTTMVAKEMKRPDKKGIIVGSIRAGGPCDSAQPAIRPGDVIVQVGDEKVDDLKALTDVTAKILAGKTGTVPTLVTYERGIQRLLTLVEIGSRKAQDPTPEAKRPWLGVETQVISKKLASALKTHGKRGVRITYIYAGTSAETAGFQVGDLVTAIDDQPIEVSEGRDASVFDEMVSNYKVGSEATFKVIRGGEKVDVKALLEAAPAPDHDYAEHEDTVLELKARDISFFDRVRHRWPKDMTGALVTAVEAGGWANFGGVHSDDLIQGVDGKPVTCLKDLVPLLDATHEAHPRTIALLVKRGIHTMFVELEPTWPAKTSDAK